MEPPHTVWTRPACRPRRRASWSRLPVWPCADRSRGCPRTTLKLAVGVLIGSFGTFWVGEGLGVHWPGADISILGPAAGFLVVSLLIIRIVQRTSAERSRPAPGRVHASTGGRS